MVDKIKFYIDNLQLPDEYFSIYTPFSFGKEKDDYKIYKLFIEYEELSPDEEDDGDENVFNRWYDSISKIEITAVKWKSGITKLYVEGNFRKWCYLKDNIRDLTQTDFIKCVERLAKAINLDVNVVWGAKVTKLETGVTLKLEDKDRGIVYCIREHEELKEIHRHGKHGVEFKGENYDVIFYDKLRLIYNRKGKLERNYKKISKENFLLRFEVQAHKVSGVSSFKEKLDTLLKVKENWGYMGKNVLKTLSEVTFVDVISPASYKLIKGGSKKEMSKYLTYKGIQGIGIETAESLLNVMKAKNRAKIKKEFIKLYSDCIKNEVDYKLFFTQKVAEKVKALSS